MNASIDYDGGLTLSMPVASLSAALDWYQQVLGFQLIYRMDEIAWCELQTPVARVTVGLSEVESPQPGGATPTFGVTDIEGARATLEQQGVRIDGDVVTIPEMVKFVTFYDPDGNSLMFYQDLKAPA